MAVFGAPAAHASVIQMTPNNIGLVGYWSFNEGTSTIAHDFSGNGNNAILLGTVPPVWTSGKLGQVLSFDGVDDGVAPVLPPSLSGASQATLCGWIYRSSTGDQPAFGAGTISDSNRYDIFWSNDGSGNLFFEVGNGNTDQFNWVALPGTGWHHVCNVFNGTLAGNARVAAYVNGVVQTLTYFVTPPSTLPTSANTGTLFFGGEIAHGYTKGTLDEIRVYNRALTATEVAALYQVGAAKINSSQSPGTLSNGLAGWWTMDGADTVWSSGTAGTEIDRSGNGNTGTLANMNRATSPILGKIGQALKFDGSSSYIDVPDASSLKPSAVTVSAWVNPSSNVPLATCGGNNVYQVQYIVFKKNSRSGNFEGYTLLAYPSGNQIQYSGDITNSGGTSDSVNSSAYNINQWHHIVMTFQQPTLDLYVDGVLVSTATHNFPLDYGTDDVFIGRTGECGAINWDGYFAGKLDDTRIYNRALSASEVQQLYNLGAGTHVNTSSANLQNGSTLQSGLMGLWTFDGSDLSGSTVYDLSGNGNNGTNNGAVPTIGKLGEALKFDGATTHVDVPANSSLRPASQMTVSAWIKSTHNIGGTYERVVDERYAQGFVLCLAGGTGANAPTAGAAMIALGTNGGGDALVLGGTTDITNDNKWHLITGTFSNGATKIYLDGNLENSATASFSSIVYNNDPVTIGYDDTTSPNSKFFKGPIDDVRVYNRALSASEVQYLYNMGK